MTTKVGRSVVIEATSPRRCDLCDVVAETRPYGPHGEEVCFECAMKDEESARRKFFEFLDGPGITPN